MNWQEIGVDAVVTMPFMLIAAMLGWWVGRRSEVQRRVDAVLRRETRPRHPSGAAEATGVLHRHRDVPGAVRRGSDIDRGQ